MAALANGGSADDLKPGVDLFHQIKQAGNFLPVDPTSATITSGQTPVVIDWDYTNAAVTKDLPTWKVVVPQDAVTAQYYNQAISKQAPHPAAARQLAMVAARLSASSRVGMTIEMRTKADWDIAFPDDRVLN